MRESERTTLADLSVLGAFGIMAIQDRLTQFLATHPVAIGVRNTLSVALGEAGTIGFSYPGAAIEEAMEDLLSL